MVPCPCSGVQNCRSRDSIDQETPSNVSFSSDDGIMGAIPNAYDARQVEKAEIFLEQHMNWRYSG